MNYKIGGDQLQKHFQKCNDHNCDHNSANHYSSLSTQNYVNNSFHSCGGQRKQNEAPLLVLSVIYVYIIHSEGFLFGMANHWMGQF